MKTVLLIGGTGLLSTAVMRTALQNEWRVFVLNRGRREERILPSVTLLQANFYDKKSIEKAIDGYSFDIVVDFLSRKPEDIQRTFPLVLSAKQYIFISTACVYLRNNGEIITENSPKPNYLWSYSVEKYECEELLKSLAKEANMTYTIVRPYITYDTTRIPFGLVSPYGTHWTIVSRILNGKPMFVWDKGNTECTLTYVDDFAQAVVGLFANDKAFNDDFHVTTDKHQSWKAMLMELYRQLNVEPNIIEIPSDFICDKMPETTGMLKADRAIDAVFDISKICNAVPNYLPKTSLKEGLTHVLDYYRQNNYLNGIDFAWDAKIDRLIYSYAIRNNLKVHRLHYCDYLKQKKLKNVYTYVCNRYEILIFAGRVLTKLKRIWKK